MRWSSNFTPELEKMGAKINYNVDNNGKEIVTVEVKIDGENVEMPWQEYLKSYVEEGKHQMMKRNVLLATRNFNHRVEAFRQNVIFGPNNPMRARHISYRVEFQGIVCQKLTHNCLCLCQNLFSFSQDEVLLTCTA